MQTEPTNKKSRAHSPLREYVFILLLILAVLWWIKEMYEVIRLSGDTFGTVPALIGVSIIPLVIILFLWRRIRKKHW
jgi:hypothetical protein